MREQVWLLVTALLFNAMAWLKLNTFVTGYRKWIQLLENYSSIGASQTPCPVLLYQNPPYCRM
jgi:hypothetical protein